MSKPTPAPPFAALFWMILNEVEASTERVLHLPVADAVRELDDVRAVITWARDAGMPAELLEQIDGATLHPTAEAKLREDAAPKFRAVFRGQAWIAGHAMEVDDSRAEFVVSQAEVDAAGGIDPECDPASDDVLSTSGDWDALAQAANAPPMVKNWPGPFDIDLFRLEDAA